MRAQAAKPRSLVTEQLLVLAALAAAVAGQGGYYLGPRLVVDLLLVAASAISIAHRGIRVAQMKWPLAALTALAVWTVASATLAGHPGAALPTVSVLAGIAVVAAITGGASSSQRVQLAWATIVLGAAAAFSGWVGVAFRVRRWAAPGPIWRAITSVTYSSAAAALMAALALLALAILIHRPSAAGRVVAMMLLVGVAATVSRAGIIGLALGYCLLLGLLGVRTVVGATAGTVLGAVIAVVALTPSMPHTSTTRPGWAIVGLLTGIGVAAAGPLKDRRVVTIALLGLACATVGLAISAQRASSSAGWGERVHLSSEGRVEEAKAGVRLVRNHPLAGVGPGRAAFFWTTPDHRLLVDRYAHDEYLQLTVEQGAVGAGLLLLLIYSIARSARHGRRGGDGNDRWMWTGAVAGLVYLLGHSGFDFLWHIPAVTLVGAMLIGLCTSPPPEPLPARTNQSEETS